MHSLINAWRINPWSFCARLGQIASACFVQTNVNVKLAWHIKANKLVCLYVMPVDSCRWNNSIMTAASLTWFSVHSVSLVLMLFMFLCVDFIFRAKRHWVKVDEALRHGGWLPQLQMHRMSMRLCVAPSSNPDLFKASRGRLQLDSRTHAYFVF